MALILNIETATPVLSLALSRDGEIIASRHNDTQNRHAELITVLIDEMMHTAKCVYDDLDAIAVSMGPGSYTGLRIGVSTAKGICYAKDIPLIAISTLQAMALGMAREIQQNDALYCPMIDARRMEVYDAFYDTDSREVREVEATIVDEDTYAEKLKDQLVVFGGNGAAKCKELIKADNAVFIDDFEPSAEFIATLAEKAFEEKTFEDVAYFEPFYLKVFKAGKPRVKGLYD